MANPVIPESITVHLGEPGDDAPNITVPFIDYIKNVASSKIYPTWPETAIRANILSQISFALNRIYTEYYRSRGYDFDITNSTAHDQSFVPGRNIYYNISRIVDEIFNSYIVRQGYIEPFFAAHCDGIEVICEGLMQWDTVSLAQDGLTPHQILQRYFGEDIDIVTDVPVEGVTPSVPTRLLREGVFGNDVRTVQVRLNRISRNFPAIPRIPTPDGIFGPETTDAVKAFQEAFGLSPDGIVGKGVWYRILNVYNAVKRVNELDSEGISFEEIQNILPRGLREGDTGPIVRELQYLLAYLHAYEPTLPALTIDGIFGPETKKAVTAAQRFFGLPEDGHAGAATYDRIYRAYRGIRDTVPNTYEEGITLPYPGYPLRIGSRGDAVKLIQEYLNYIRQDYDEIPQLVVDGVFGPATQNAVMVFQRLFGIEPNGIVGAQTWNEMAAVYHDVHYDRQSHPGQFPGIVIGL